MEESGVSLVFMEIMYGPKGKQIGIFSSILEESMIILGYVQGTLLKCCMLLNQLGEQIERIGRWKALGRL